MNTERVWGRICSFDSLVSYTKKPLDAKMLHTYTTQ